jgi:hypothetical protein
MPPIPQGYWEPVDGRKLGVFVFYACTFDECRFGDDVAIVAPLDEVQKQVDVI